MAQRPATIAHLLQAYLAADYRWEWEGQWYFLHLGQPAPGVEAAFPEATRFGLLSAWDPHSVKRSKRENQSADEALHFWLADSGLDYRPAFSSARDRTWREPSWLVAGLPVEAFDSLAERFGQLGTLWWSRGEPIRLRMHAACPDACGDERHVDWLK